MEGTEKDSVKDIESDRLEGNDFNEVFDSVVAVSDYDALDDSQLSFKRGRCIRVVNRVTEDWLWADIDGVLGYVPSNHVKDMAEFEEMEKWQDEEYFESYCHMRLHLEMLGDVPRTEAYRMAVLKNTTFVEDKVVLDVGCGTGILSMFCAREGKAKKVYAIEASSMADHITDVIKENKLETTINVLKGRVESIIPPEKVDLIISEWMGTFLLFEFMIDSVLYARDNWLKPNGIMWPSFTQLFVVPCMTKELYEKKVGVWNEQYGFNFSTFKQKAINDFFNRPVIDHDLLPSNYLSEPQPIAALDMMTIDVHELESWSCDFRFSVNRQGIFHGFGSWFDVEFHVPNDQNSVTKSKPTVLSTSPSAPKTHWKNAIFILDVPVEVSKGSLIDGVVKVVRNPDFRRHMTICFDFSVFERENDLTSKHILKEFKLWR